MDSVNFFQYNYLISIVCQQKKNSVKLSTLGRFTKNGIPFKKQTCEHSNAIYLAYICERSVPSN